MQPDDFVKAARPYFGSMAGLMVLYRPVWNRLQLLFCSPELDPVLGQVDRHERFAGWLFNMMNQNLDSTNLP